MLTPIEDLPPVASAQARTLDPGGVDLWCFFYEGLDGSGLVDSYLALMTQEERARHDRFYFARDRLLFLATRALVRTVLSNYAPLAPTQWRFSEGERGKPYIANALQPAAIHFNLTNTPGLVVCAVSLVHPLLGVDAENLQRAGETLNIAEHYFSAYEVRALRGLPSSRQRERFFSYWTLKESYIKARGLGLAIPLEQFSFILDKEQPSRESDSTAAGSGIGVEFDPRLGDDSSRWRFALLRGGESHLIAVGADTGGSPLQVRAVHYLPLRGIIPWRRPISWAASSERP